MFFGSKYANVKSEMKAFSEQMCSFVNAGSYSF